MNQNYDDMSRVNVVTEISATTFFTQHTLLNRPEGFGHAVDKSKSASTIK